MRLCTSDPAIGLGQLEASPRRSDPDAARRWNDEPIQARSATSRACARLGLCLRSERRCSETPSPIEVKAIIATDAPSFSYYALDVAPDAALSNITTENGMIPLLAKRLSKLWPELANTIVIEGVNSLAPRLQAAIEGHRIDGP